MAEIDSTPPRPVWPSMPSRKLEDEDASEGEKQRKRRKKKQQDNDKNNKDDDRPGRIDEYV